MTSAVKAFLVGGAEKIFQTEDEIAELNLLIKRIMLPFEVTAKTFAGVYGMTEDEIDAPVQHDMNRFERLAIAMEIDLGLTIKFVECQDPVEKEQAFHQLMEISILSATSMQRSMEVALEEREPIGHVPFVKTINCIFEHRISEGVIMGNMSFYVLRKIPMGETDFTEKRSAVPVEVF